MRETTFSKTLNLNVRNLSVYYYRIFETIAIRRVYTTGTCSKAIQLRRIVVCNPRTEHISRAAQTIAAGFGRVDRTRAIFLFLREPLSHNVI